MAISEAAQRNHHAMFPDHHSTLKVTDPEFVELFDNWAFDEVMSDAPLDPRTRLMTQLAAIVACQGISEFLAFPMTPAGARAPESGQARSLKNSRANRRVTSEHRQWPCRHLRDRAPASGIVRYRNSPATQSAMQAHRNPCRKSGARAHLLNCAQVHLDR